MKVKLSILTALSVLCFASCKNAGSGMKDEESRLQYVPERNLVEVIKLERKDFPMQLLSNGKLAAAQKSALFFKESGVITEINAANGDFVRKGDVIARLEDSGQKTALASAEIELQKSELEYLDALVGLGFSSTDTVSVPADVKNLAMIRSGYKAARISYDEAKASLDGMVLRAPFSGKIAGLKLKTWDMPSSSEPFCTIIDDSRFEVTFTALESEYPFLKKGQPVRVALFTDQNNYTTGSIKSVNPMVDENGQIEVRAEIRGDGRMIDGMNVKVIVENTLTRQLVVPKSAVVVRDDLDVLFRYRDGSAEWVYVNILDANSEDYVVSANESRGAELNEGDLIIVSGNLNLANGSKVVIKEQ